MSGLITFASTGGTGYTPADLSADLVGGVAQVLPYVGAGVGGGVALLFVFMGIRKGFAFFRGIGK